MFYSLKLFLTNKPYYKQWRYYTKCRKTVQKKLKQKIKYFCPWSGYYIHEIVKIMIDFYHEIYSSHSCCWSEDERIEKIASSLTKVKSYIEKLEELDDLELEEILNTASCFSDFNSYVAKYAEKCGFEEVPENIKPYLAYDFLEKKYTTSIYNLIGENIWEWCD